MQPSARAIWDQSPGSSANSESPRSMQTAGCEVRDDLVSRVTVLNEKLNKLSPTRLDSPEPEALAEVHAQRASLFAEMKRHQAKGHDGKPCPAARYPARIGACRVV
jgi:hypothetical protein